MTSHVIAFVGISGVGKSTLLRELSNQFLFQHIEASVLIREGRRSSGLQEVSPESLRHENIDENQRLLISQFRKTVDSKTNLIVLDGHSVIDTPSGLIPIQSPVFKVLGVHKIIFLADEPKKIEKRRIADASRNRPTRSARDLEAHQTSALLNAFKISVDLEIPLVVITPNQREFLRFQLSEINSRPFPKPKT